MAKLIIVLDVEHIDPTLSDPHEVAYLALDQEALSSVVLAAEWQRSSPQPNDVWRIVKTHEAYSGDATHTHIDEELEA